MKTFVLHLQSGTQYERIEGVTSFAGEDGTGSFGILPAHERMMSLLTFGLARFRVGAEDWEYLAVPGGLVYFRDNELYLSTRRYVRGGDYEAVRAELQVRFKAEEAALVEVKGSVRRLEEAMVRRLLEMNRGRPV